MLPELETSTMGRLNFLHHPYVFIIAFTVILMSMEAITIADEDRQVYIVYLGSLPKGRFSPMSQHLSVLDEVLEGSSSSDSLVRSYKRSFNGFAARLTEKEKGKLANKEGVVSVFPNRIYKPQTTRSWDFLGLSETHQPKPAFESDVIIGILDTGIWPESKSFSDKGFGPPPKKWKGVCSGGQNFTCNKKIIGAKIYNSVDDPDTSVRDRDGHGTHTSSIAAGSNVKKVSFHGFAGGKARGGVPSARIAMYKVCFPAGCAGADILAAFDDAISDGVDIISISLGFDSLVELVSDPIAIGAFHAMEGGILTVQSAGNAGPTVFSINSLAPWIISVAASTIDRKIVDRVVLGDGTKLTGRSFNYHSMNGSMYPLIYGRAANIPRGCTNFLRKACAIGCLNETAIKGKIVICDSAWGDEDTFKLGAAGTIKWDLNEPSVVPFPTVALLGKSLRKVRSYYNSSKNPTAKILKSETLHDASAPVVAPFSSRGPNLLIPHIMKPDISAPGVDILAAYSPLPILPDKKSVDYNILSGTSMAAPHVAGVSAYIKSFHPTWSPSAVRSALMTTARPMKDSASLHGALSFGAGHVDPVKAVNPGLVYETSKDDYIQMLCDIGYNTTSVRLISGDNSSCPKGKKGSPKDLNYPTMAFNVTQLRPFRVEFSRTVTNVGPSKSTYKAKVVVGKNPRIKVKVNPPMLSFKKKMEKKSFVVSVTGKGMTMEKPVESASVVWSDGTHIVRSPIFIYTDMLIDV